MDSKSPEAFRTISEVAEWLGVPAHVLRFWESRFGQVKPVKRAGGRRYYRPSDMELLGGIRKLLHEDGLTIRGVQKLLREKGVKHVAAMSPPIDQPADLRDVEAAPGEAEAAETPGVEIAEPGEIAPVFETEIEDAVEIEQEAPTPVEETGPSEAEMTETPPVPVSAPEAPPPAAEDGPLDRPLDRPPDGPPDGPLDGPEAVEFFAHDAEPDTAEGPGDDALSHVFSDGAAADNAPEATPGPAVADSAAVAAAPQPVAPTPVETVAPAFAEIEDSPAEPPQTAGVAPDPARTDSPDPPAAQGISGETVPGEETGPVAAPEGRVTAAPGEAASAPTAPAPAPTPSSSPAAKSPQSAQDTVPPEPARPGPGDRDPGMPEIGADPADDADIVLPPGLAAALRRHRAGSGGAQLNPVTLQAFADRLEELSGRLGQTPDGRRPF